MKKIGTKTIKILKIIRDAFSLANHRSLNLGPLYTILSVSTSIKNKTKEKPKTVQNVVQSKFIHPSSKTCLTLPSVASPVSSTLRVGD